MPKKNSYHQDGVDVHKFDKAADVAAQSQFEPLFNTDGQRIVMPGAFRARVKAQMDSHKRKGKK